MSYHLDPFSKEPARCTFAYGACIVAKQAEHYGNISEAVRTRDEMRVQAASLQPR